MDDVVVVVVVVVVGRDEKWSVRGGMMGMRKKDYTRDLKSRDSRVHNANPCPEPATN